MIYPTPGSCKLPDASVVHTFQCACNDTAYSIVPARAADGLPESAFWCTTVMSMLAYDGSQIYVYNPFTLDELRAKLDIPPIGLPLDTYLACVAGGGTQCSGPTDPFFVQQQVSMVAVYQRCLANYQSLQWDLGTHVLFNATLKTKLPVSVPEPDCVAVPGYPCLGTCLLMARAAGSSPAACLDAYLQGQNVASIDYFQYIPLAAPQDQPLPSSQIDACGAYTGPAKLAFPGQGDFQACLSQYDNTSVCQLPLMVWSGRSSNRVPVASPHATRMLTESEKVDAARRVFRETRDTLNALLMKLNETWNANDLEIAIFSAEGDLLHQYFDCVMMGALATKIDLWPAPDSLNRPFWSRRTDGATSREFELPCSGAQLNSRLGVPDTKTPLTCGSHSRRSAIKYFLRRALSGGGQDAARQTILKVVRQLIADLMAAWVTDDNFLNYQCQCDNGTHSYGCCAFDCTFHSKCLCPDGVTQSFACCGCVSTSLLPSVLQVPFTTIPGNQTMGGVIDQAAMYLKSTIWTSTDPWLTYDPGATSFYQGWKSDPAQAATAQDHALFDTTADVVHYDTGELGVPLATSIWEMCMGLAGQVHHTIPLGRSTGAPTTLGEAFNPPSSAPSGGWSSKTLNLTYTEDWIRSLMLDAYGKSPIFWHYSMRHTPSPSTMCQRTAPSPLNLSSASNIAPLSSFGWDALTLGGVGLDCYCGWWFNATHCQPPEPVCALLYQVAYGGPSQYQRCVLHKAGDFDMEGAMRSLEAYLNGQWPSSWSCPSFMASDHWGFLGLGNMSPSVLNRTLFRGPSGLRAGSLSTQTSTLLMTPFQRTDAGLPPPLQCNPAPPRSLVDHFVDDLFPAAQGVRQSPLVSYCLRFIVELARRLAYEQLGLAVPASQQIQVEATWRKRCEAKLNQTIFCEAYGVFSVPSTAPSCPFVLAQSFASFASITPSCLVVFAGKVYDPCLCNPVFCQATQYVVTPTTDLYSRGDLCRVPHPRDYVVQQIIGQLPTSSWPPPAPLAGTPQAASSAGASPVPASLVRCPFAPAS